MGARGLGELGTTHHFSTPSQGAEWPDLRFHKGHSLYHEECGKDHQYRLLYLIIKMTP